MKITKLVILFNKNKLLLGLVTAFILFTLSTFRKFAELEITLQIIGLLILVNLAASIIASYILYDRSDLYKPDKLFKNLRSKKIKKAILVHASFDPISNKIEQFFPNTKLSVYNIFGNRHEKESVIKISEKEFPPNKRDIKIDPTNLPDENESCDVIFAITSLHEILTHEKRVKFFEEAKRIMHEDGTLIVCEQMRNLKNFIFFNIGAFHFISKKKWKLAIEEADLKIIKNKHLTPFAEILYIKKRYS